MIYLVALTRTQAMFEQMWQFLSYVFFAAIVAMLLVGVVGVMVQHFQRRNGINHLPHRCKCSCKKSNKLEER